MEAILTEHDWLTCTEPILLLSKVLPIDNGSQPVGHLTRPVVINCTSPTRGLETYRLVDDPTRCLSMRKLRLMVSAIYIEQYGLDSSDAKISPQLDPIGWFEHWARGKAHPDGFDSGIETFSELVRKGAHRPTLSWFINDSNHYPYENRHEVLAQRTHIVREIAGNPFRPLIIDPKWRTPEVLALAQFIYDELAFDDLPILRDVLIEVGCDDTYILNHCHSLEPTIDLCLNCKGKGWVDNLFAKPWRVICKYCDGIGESLSWQPMQCPHVRGCHLIDTLLNFF